MISNRWTFYPDGTLTHEHSSNHDGTEFQSRKFGDYTIQGNMVLTQLGTNPRETRFVIIDADTLLGDKSTSIYERELSYVQQADS